MWQGLARFARNRMALFGAAVLLCLLLLLKGRLCSGCGCTSKITGTVRDTVTCETSLNGLHSNR